MNLLKIMNVKKKDIIWYSPYPDSVVIGLANGKTIEINKANYLDDFTYYLPHKDRVPTEQKGELMSVKKMILEL